MSRNSLRVPHSAEIQDATVTNSVLQGSAVLPQGLGQRGPVGETKPPFSEQGKGPRDLEGPIPLQTESQD